MDKAPASQFYWNDWAVDLEAEPLEIEGAWIRICCKLWNDESKCSATKTLAQWRKILGVSRPKTINILQYLSIKIAKISPYATLETRFNDDIFILSRRMERDQSTRIANKSNNNRRQKTWYDKNKPNAKPNGGLQTPLQSSSSSSSSDKNTPLTPIPKQTPPNDIMETPVRTIIALYNTHVAPLGNPQAEYDQLAAMGAIMHIQDRWGANPDIEFWESFFVGVSGMPHLVGKSSKAWYASLDWIVKERNFLKILQGSYLNRAKSVDIKAVVEELVDAIGRIDTGNLKNLSEPALAVVNHETFKINKIGRMTKQEATRALWGIVRGVFGSSR